jgi:electron transfer flavoprotein alpha subunit
MANGILILAEQLKGELTDITFEMLGVGRQLADAMKAPLHAVLVGPGAGSQAKQLGLADKVFVVDDPKQEVPAASTLATLLKGLIDSQNDGLVLVAGTNLALGIGPALSVQANLPFINYARSMRAEDGAVVVTSRLFGGKILSDVRLTDGRGIVSVYPGSFPADAGKSDKSPAVETAALPAEAPKVSFRKFIEPESGDVDITKQNVLVAVGRGIGNQDNVEMAEELAAIMGGAVCGSRPVVDQGWLAMTRQVGKSGMSVKPRLYVALGISGAPEHWEGMQNSQMIVAVNTDAKAPIFDGAQYGICGDALEILPVLTEKIKARKG